MPDLDGYEICRRLRAAEATRELPIMFLSSLEDVTDKARGFEVGGNDYLTKPFEILEVKARVRSLLKAKSYADAVRRRRSGTSASRARSRSACCPRISRAQTQRTGLDVHAVLEPAHQVGGDLFEVLRLGAGRVLVAVGDVSGKGIPAALFMAVTMTILRSMARQGHSPEEILRRLNDELLEQNPRGMFVTLQLMVFDGGAAAVTCASAGHHAAVRIAPGRAAAARLLDVGTRARADARRGRSAARRWTLAPGDTFVLFTDGVSEAFDKDGELLRRGTAARSSVEPRQERSARTRSRRRSWWRCADMPAGTKQSDDITVCPSATRAVRGIGHDALRSTACSSLLTLPLAGC